MKQEILRFERVAIQPPRLPPLWDVSFSLYQGEAVLLTGLFQSGLRTLTALLEGKLGGFSGRILTRNGSYSRLSREAAVCSDIAVIGHDSHFMECLPFWESLQLAADKKRPLGLWKQLPFSQEAIHLADLLQLDLQAENFGNTEFVRIKWEIFAAFARGSKLFWFEDFSETAGNDALLQLHDALIFLKERGCTLVMASFHGALWWFTPIADRCLVVRHGMITMSLYSSSDGSFNDDQLRHLIAGRKFLPKWMEEEPTRAEKELSPSEYSIRVWGNEEYCLPQGRIVGLYDEAGKIPTDTVAMLPFLRTVLALKRNGHSVNVNSFLELSKQKVAIVANGSADRLILKNLSPAENVGLFASHCLPGHVIYKAELSRYLLADTVKRYSILKNCAESYDCGNCYNLSATELTSLALAKWLACNPKLFLWTAPLAQEDIKQTERLRALRKTLCEEGRTVLILSGDYDYLEDHCEDIFDI